MELADGRMLAWTEWGPADGHPVLFCTGAGMSGSLGFGLDVLARLGIRLLAVDRPGLGRSTSNPAGTLRTWAADIGQLAGRLNLREVTAVGFSQGAPFALALAGAGPARAVAVVAGTDELTAVRHLVTDEVAAMLDAIAADPSAAERRFAATTTAESLWQMVIRFSGIPDRDFHGESGFAAAYRACLTEGFRGGAGGYARDLVTASTPWTVCPEDVTAPVDLWYGLLDTSPVHSPDFGATLALRLPDARLHTIEDEGSSILWNRAPEILETLLRRASLLPPEGVTFPGSAAPPTPGD
ncbi:alpha/beta hydrolase [Amycolatopsis antarctica]|uniref:Alpha/beta hydrolase n=1 Tax=Amycolatopsis antarctica TaxID=1854586 RepID=A0A263D9S7_9PSEU|nr:alpha/beta hydrolase [Amycolatopsis antarctica]